MALKPSSSVPPRVAGSQPAGSAAPWLRRCNWPLLFLTVILSYFAGQELGCTSEPLDYDGSVSVVGDGVVYYSHGNELGNRQHTCTAGKSCWVATEDDDGGPSAARLDVRTSLNPDVVPANFVQWECNTGNTITPNIELTGSDSCVAVFCPTYDLNLNLEGNGGSVKVVTDPLTSVIYRANVPQGVATYSGTPETCGIGGCTVRACSTSTVTLTPRETSSVFSGWDGDTDCTDDNNSDNAAEVSMDADKSCTAEFDYAHLEVTVSGNGHVYSASGGLDCTEVNSPCVAEYPLITVSLMAKPSIGAEFIGWNGDCQVSLTNPLAASLLMRDVTAPYTCSAEFQGGVTLGDPGVVELVSLNPGGPNLGDLQYAPTTIYSPPNAIGRVDLSGDGRVSVFRALTPGVVSTIHTYYARDVDANTTAEVADDSRSFFTPTTTSQTQISISADGRYAAFDSADTALPINNDPSITLARRIFIKDLLTGDVQPVSVNDPANGIELADQAGYQPAISGNGRYVAFSARLVRHPSATQTIVEFNWTVVVRDTCFGGVPDCIPSSHVVSLTDEGVRPINPNSQSLLSYSPSISADGRFVAFVSSSLMLLTGDANTNGYGPRRIFLHDRDADGDHIFDETPSAGCSDTNDCPISTRLISPQQSPISNQQVTNFSETPVISANGRIVVYYNNDPALEADLGSTVLWYDTCVGAPAPCLPSPALTTGVPGTGTSNDLQNYNPDVSGDGRFISMTSYVFPAQPVVVRDTCFGVSPCSPETRVVTINTSGNMVTADDGRLSADGKAVVFVSNASNLVPSNTGVVPDVFLAQTGFMPTGGTPTLTEFAPLPSASGGPYASPSAGSPQRLFAIAGGGFVPGATVLLEGVQRPTIYVNAARLQFRATDNDLAQAGTFEVKVANPGTNPASDPLYLTVGP